MYVCMYVCMYVRAYGFFAACSFFFLSLFFFLKKKGLIILIRLISARDTRSHSEIGSNRIPTELHKVGMYLCMLNRCFGHAGTQAGLAYLWLQCE